MPGLPPIVALEIGTSFTRAMVGEAREDGGLVVTGLGEERSSGVRKGLIVSMESAADGARRALERAEEHSGVDIARVYLAASGGHILAQVNRGVVQVLNDEREITREEIRDVAEAARKISLPPERVVLHSIAQHYYVDEQEGVVNPEGMEGSRLELDMLIIHAEGALLRNTMRVAQSVGVEVDDVAFGGLCAALGVLTPEQKAGGVLVINLGGGTTEYLVYANQTVAAAGVVAVGGDHVTNDIALGLRVPLAQAERLKIEHGAAEPDAAQRRQTISLPAESGFPGRVILLGDLHVIIHARMQELLRIVKKHLDRQGVTVRLGAGIVLTGGGALLRRLPELASREFNLPCAIGRPRGVSGLAVAGGPEYATLVGLLRYAQISGARSGRGRLGGWIRRLLRGQGAQTE